eukprot:3977037-Ditylum_brightwellii.AAC.1
MSMKDIFTHSLHQGIYIPILASASKESTLGKAWKTLHPSKQNQPDDMAYILGRFLNHDDTSPKYADDLRNIVSAANSNGYIALHNLLIHESPSTVRQSSGNINPMPM